MKEKIRESLKISKYQNAIDEIVGEVKHFHLEKMDDRNWWIGLTDVKGNNWHIDIWESKGKIIVHIEQR